MTADEARRVVMHTLAEAMGEASMTTDPKPDLLVTLCERAVREARDYRHTFTTDEETPGHA